VEPRKNGIDDLICKAEIEADVEKKCVDTQGEGGSGMNYLTEKKKGGDFVRISLLN